MLGSKRAAPSGGFEVQQAKAGNWAPRSVYEFTISKLRAGARLTSARAAMDVNHQQNGHVVLAERNCWQCSKPNLSSRLRQCDECKEFFCPPCSIDNFEERHDRTFCLECNVRDLQTRFNKKI